MSGKIVRMKGAMIEIEARDKRIVEVDVEPAIKSHRAYVLAVGGMITAYGSYDDKGVMHAKGRLSRQASPGRLAGRSLIC